MENILSVLIPVALVLVLLRILALPIRWSVKLLINGGCGFLCLWLLNWISGFTGVFFPINPITAAIAGFLGLPGIALLAAVQWFL